MSINRPEFNATGQRVCDLVKPNLDGRGSIVVSTEEGDRIRLDVISPDHLQRTAAALEAIYDEVTKATSKAIMRIRLPILLAAALLAAAILVAFRDELHARGPHRLNRLAEPVTECGFWGDMAAGMSCR
jgi:hypothetical protein